MLGGRDPRADARPRAAGHGRGDAGARRGLRRARRLPAGVLPGRARGLRGGARRGLQPQRPGGHDLAAGPADRRQRARPRRDRPATPAWAPSAPGWRANLTIGRALRLLVTLTGGGVPGGLDRATLGHSRQARRLHRRGRGDEPLGAAVAWSAASRPGTSTVTLIAADAPLSISDHRSTTPEQLASCLGWAAASQWSTNWWPLAATSLFVICPEHARPVRRRGLEQGRRPHGDLRGRAAPGARAARLRRGAAGDPGRRPRRADPQVVAARGRPADRGRAARPAASPPSTARRSAWAPRSSPGRCRRDRVRHPRSIRAPAATTRSRRAPTAWPAAAWRCSTSPRTAARSSSTASSERLRARRRDDRALRQAALLARRHRRPDRAGRDPRRPGRRGPGRLRIVRVVQCARRRPAGAARRGHLRGRHRALRRRGAGAGARCSACRPTAWSSCRTPCSCSSAAELDAVADVALPAIVSRLVTASTPVSSTP